MQQTLYLSFTLPDGEPQKLELKPQAGEPIQIGRNRASHIKLNLPSLSRAHAKIFFESGAFWVEDLGSSNGTFVNREQVHHVRIAPGDVIQCGEFEIEVLSHAETSVYQASPDSELEEVEVIVEEEGELSPPLPPSLEPRPPRAPLPKLSAPPRAAPPLNPTLNRTPVVHSKAPTNRPHELNRHAEPSLMPQAHPQAPLHDPVALERAEAERDALSSRVEQLSSELTQAREETHMTRAQLEAELNEEREERAALDRALNEAREELSALRDSHERAERSTEDVDEELKSLRGMLSALKGERAQLEADLTETRARLETSLNEREAEAERAAQLTRELSEARAELEAQREAQQEAQREELALAQEAHQEALKELQTQRDLAQEALMRARAELSTERERAHEATVATPLTEALPQPNAHATSPDWAAHQARFEQLTQELLRLKMSTHQASVGSSVSPTPSISRSPQAQRPAAPPQEVSPSDAPTPSSSSSTEVSRGPQAREWRGLV